MSSFLCFLCHSTVNSDTNEETREKYKEIVGLYLCMDSHLCYICCHVLNKLCQFRALCLKRSLEYPMLFRERGTLNLQRTELEVQTICSEENCTQYHMRNANSKFYHIQCDDPSPLHHQEYTDNSLQHQDYVDNSYAKLADEGKEFDELFQQDTTAPNIDNTQKSDEQIDLEHSNSSQEENLSETNNEFEEFNNDDQYFDADAENPMTDNFDADPTTDSVYDIDKDIPANDITDDIDTQEESTKDKKKSKKGKKKEFEKILLTLEQQKQELEGRRKEKKYIEAEFKCYNCALGFLFKDTYQTHMMRHEESNGEYRCDICTLRFASPAVLRAHLVGHRERHICTRCGEHVKRRGRGTHARQCGGGGEGVACHLCGGMFADSSGLQQHLKRFHHMSTSRRSYPCGVCANTYNNQAAVRTHMIKHIARKFTCTSCPSTFSSPYTLAQHSKTHSATQPTLYSCQACDVTYTSKKSLMTHLRNSARHQQTVLECPICSRSCPGQKSLAAHIKRHTDPRPPAPRAPPKVAVCHLCGKRFQGNNKLNRHLRQVCEKAKLEEEFACLYEQHCMDTG